MKMQDQVISTLEHENAALRARVHELEGRSFSPMLVWTINSILSAGHDEGSKFVLAMEYYALQTKLAALTQAHQQIVKDRDMQASTIRSMRATIDGLNVLVDSLSSGNEQRDAQLQQAVEALAEYAEAKHDFDFHRLDQDCDPIAKVRFTRLVTAEDALKTLAFLATHKEKG